MAKLKIVADETFNAPVPVPVAGKGVTLVDFTFKHREKDALAKWAKLKQDDLDAILDIACGWENDESFDRANVGKFLQSYPGAARAITTVYFEESSGARAKN